MYTIRLTIEERDDEGNVISILDDHGGDMPESFSDLIDASEYVHQLLNRPFAY